MNIKCVLGLHIWDGCRCVKCYKTRDEQHDWTLNCEVCSKCGTIRYNAHNYLHLQRYCSICGTEKKEGIFLDRRGRRTYKTIRIGNQTMMAENLRYKPELGNCWVYEEKEENAEKYGYLYDWKTACDIADGIEGWHLPTKEEWETLLSTVGHVTLGHHSYYALIDSGYSGFNPLFGGNKEHGWFYGKDSYAEFWSSTEIGGQAWRLFFDSNGHTVHIWEAPIDMGCSVRLFRD